MHQEHSNLVLINPKQKTSECHQQSSTDLQHQPSRPRRSAQAHPPNRLTGQPPAALTPCVRGHSPRSLHQGRSHSSERGWRGGGFSPEGARPAASTDTPGRAPSAPPAGTPPPPPSCSPPAAQPLRAAAEQRIPEPGTERERRQGPGGGGGGGGKGGRCEAAIMRSAGECRREAEAPQLPDRRFRRLLH